MASSRSENSDLDFLSRQASEEETTSDRIDLDIEESPSGDAEYSLPAEEPVDFSFIGKVEETQDESPVIELQIPDDEPEGALEDEEVIRFVEVPNDESESTDIEILDDDSFSGISLDSDHMLAVDELEILSPMSESETDEGTPEAFSVPDDEKELELLLPESELVEFSLEPDADLSLDEDDEPESSPLADEDLLLVDSDVEMELQTEDSSESDAAIPDTPAGDFALEDEGDSQAPGLSDDEADPGIDFADPDPQPPASELSLTESPEPKLSAPEPEATESPKQDEVPPSDAPAPSVSGLEQFLKSNQHREVQKRVKDQVAKAREDANKKKSKKKSKGAKDGTSLPFATFFENRRMLGLDIGTHSVKYVHLKSGSGGYRLLNSAMHPLPEHAAGISDDDKLEIVSDKLSSILNAKLFKNTWVTTAISGLEILFKNIQIPRIGRKEMDKAVPWACRKDSPFPIEETTFEYSVIGGKSREKEEKQDVFVVAAKKQLIESHVELLKKASMRPDKLSTVPSALLHLFKAYVKKPGDACHVLIDIGSHSSHIVFIMNGELQFVREISTASYHFNESLFGNILHDGQEINLSHEQAEQVKKKHGIPLDPGEEQTEDGIPLKELSTMMMPVAEKLSSEIQRTIDFYREKFKVERETIIYLTGGGALMPNLITILDQSLNSSVHLLNPFDILTRKRMTEEEQRLHQIGPRFSVAVGLALDQSKQLNMLPKHLKGSTSFEYFKRIFRYLFFIFVLAMVLLSQKMNYQFDEVETEFNRLSAEYNAAQPRRKLFLQLQKELQELSKRQEAYRKSLDIRLHSAEHLKAISNLIPPDISLTSLEVTDRTRTTEGDEKGTYQAEVLLLSGVAFEKNSMEGINLAEFLMEIEKSGYFSAVFLRSQKMRVDGSIDFLIECETFD